MQKPASVALVNALHHPVIIVTFTYVDQSPHLSPDMAGHLIYDEGAQEFQYKFEDSVVHNRWIMALVGQFEKTGEAGLYPTGTPFNFSRLCSPPGIFYASLRITPMPKRAKPTHILVTWEAVPNPDPYALLKAVAMLFNRKVPLSPDVDLTKPAGELTLKEESHH